MLKIKEFITYLVGFIAGFTGLLIASTMLSSNYILNGIMILGLIIFPTLYAVIGLTKEFQKYQSKLKYRHLAYSYCIGGIVFFIVVYIAFLFY